MSYTVLARKYRSVNFDELIGQEHVAQTLKRAIESGRIAHAYLFCGTRGTGKTSTARILAKALNCLKYDAPTATPCGKCDSCLAIARGEDIDVIEIDAASNTGVDNVREIIENARYRPARSRFKVYIIDEVHMLSKSAFNALLKTLEEPPSHVEFILATTEPEKVLPTILSRCQRYDFRNIASKEIAGHLKEICSKEKISAEEDALALVAKAGAGSMRDALSLLDRLLSVGEKKLTSQQVEEMLGLPRAQRVAELAAAIAAGDVKRTLEQVESMIASGLAADSMIGALSDYLRNLLVARTCGSGSGLLDVPGVSTAELAKQAEKFDAVTLAQDIAILEELRRNMRHSQTGRAMLDAALVRLALAGQFASIGELLSGGEKKKVEGLVGAARDSSPSIGTPGGGRSGGRAVAHAVPMEVQEEPPPLSSPGVPGEEGMEDLTVLRAQLLALLEKQAPGVANALRMTEIAAIEDGIALIRFPQRGESFAKTWSANGKKDQIAQALTELRGQATGVRFEVDETGANEPAALPVESDPLVLWVLKEFGGRVAAVE